MYMYMYVLSSQYVHLAVSRMPSCSLVHLERTAYMEATGLVEAWQTSMKLCSIMCASMGLGGRARTCQGTNASSLCPGITVSTCGLTSVCRVKYSVACSVHKLWIMHS